LEKFSAENDEEEAPNDNTQQRSCHVERSEESLACSGSQRANPEMFRFAQHDTIKLGD
jgi:hypothetical protein